VVNTAVARDERPAQLERLTARQVLDKHADLQRALDRPSGQLQTWLAEIAQKEAEEYPAWAASHLHPAVSTRDIEPWLRSLPADLAGASTFQVTAEMVELAENLTVITPDLEVLPAEELPALWGFIWLDKPVPRPAVDDNGRPPERINAFSWAQVPAMQVRVSYNEAPGEVITMSGIRFREWAADPAWPASCGPLRFMGQVTVPVGAVPLAVQKRMGLTADRIRTVLPQHKLYHMLWILMGMEIVTSDLEPVDRHTRRRAANLRQQQVHVIRLRRATHHELKSGDHREVNWNCTWLVRGHWRQAPHGGTFRDGRARTYVKPHLKGPDGMPLKAHDILYKLCR
jgi:hypothetical protein